jgi:hypothetical protein
LVSLTSIMLLSISMAYNGIVVMTKTLPNNVWHDFVVGTECGDRILWDKLGRR